MKKYIKFLGITLLFVTLLSSCSTKELDVLEPELEGLYKLQSLTVATPVDINNDGVFNIDLSKEGFDLEEGEQYETGGRVIYIYKNNERFVREFKYDKKNRIINILGGATPYSFEDVKITFANNGKKKLFYKQWNASIAQMTLWNFEEN